LIKRAGLRWSIADIDVDPSAAVIDKCDRPGLAMRTTGDDEVFCRAAQADEKMMVIRVEDGGAARQVGQDACAGRQFGETLWLRIVSIGC
jgi:hypothetical protein